MLRYNFPIELFYYRVDINGSSILMSEILNSQKEYDDAIALHKKIGHQLAGTERVKALPSA